MAFHFNFLSVLWYRDEVWEKKRLLCLFKVECGSVMTFEACLRRCLLEYGLSSARLLINLSPFVALSLNSFLRWFRL